MYMAPRIEQLPFNQWLIMHRVIAELSRQSVAESIGVSRDTYTRWEKGETEPNVSPRVILRLCDLLEMALLHD